MKLKKIIRTKESLAQRYTVEQLHQGDEKLFVDVINVYTPIVTAYIKKMQGPNETVPSAEDLAQETMIKIWNKKKSIEGDFKSLSAYIIKTATRTALEQFRKDKRTPTYQGAELDDDVFHTAQMTIAERYEIKEELESVVSFVQTHLGEKQRDVFMLSYVHDMAVNDAATLLGADRSRVKESRKRALDNIKKYYIPE